MNPQASATPNSSAIALQFSPYWIWESIFAGRRLVLPTPTSTLEDAREKPRGPQIAPETNRGLVRLWLGRFWSSGIDKPAVLGRSGTDRGHRPDSRCMEGERHAPASFRKTYWGGAVCRTAPRPCVVSVTEADVGGRLSRQSETHSDPIDPPGDSGYAMKTRR